MQQKKLLIAIIVVLLFSFLYVVVTQRTAPVPNNPPIEQPETIPEGEGVACTLDAKICPDGSSVGRVPPSCEFEACP